MRSGAGATCDGGGPPEIQHEREALRVSWGRLSLECCDRQNQSFREIALRNAKNTKGVLDILSAAAWPSRDSALLPQVAVLTNVIVFDCCFVSWFLDSRVAGCEQVTSMCFQLNCT